MLNSLRRFFSARPEPTAEQLAYREKLSAELLGTGKVLPAVYDARQSEYLVGMLVGFIFQKALNTRGAFRDTLTVECLHTLTIRWRMPLARYPRKQV